MKHLKLFESYTKNIVKSKIKHPDTGKLLSDVYINNKGVYRWNTAYKVYNSIDNYAQLMKKDLNNIVWDSSL